MKGQNRTVAIKNKLKKIEISDKLISSNEQIKFNLS
jgi:hypothetical protein